MAPADQHLLHAARAAVLIAHVAAMADEPDTLIADEGWAVQPITESLIGTALINLLATAAGATAEETVDVLGMNGGVASIIADVAKTEPRLIVQAEPRSFYDQDEDELAYEALYCLGSELDHLRDRHDAHETPAYKAQQASFNEAMDAAKVALATTASQDNDRTVNLSNGMIVKRRPQNNVVRLLQVDTMRKRDERRSVSGGRRTSTAITHFRFARLCLPGRLLRGCIRNCSDSSFFVFADDRELMTEAEADALSAASKEFITFCGTAAGAVINDVTMPASKELLLPAATPETVYVYFSTYLRYRKNLTGTQAGSSDLASSRLSDVANPVTQMTSQRTALQQLQQQQKLWENGMIREEVLKAAMVSKDPPIATLIKTEQVCKAAACGGGRRALLLLPHCYCCRPLLLLPPLAHLRMSPSGSSWCHAGEKVVGRQGSLQG